jgi:hypothetical protein
MLCEVYAASGTLPASRGRLNGASRKAGRSRATGGDLPFNAWAGDYSKGDGTQIELSNGGSFAWGEAPGAVVNGSPASPIGAAPSDVQERRPWVAGRCRPRSQ